MEKKTEKETNWSSVYLSFVALPSFHSAILVCLSLSHPLLVVVGAFFGAYEIRINTSIFCILLFFRGATWLRRLIVIFRDDLFVYTKYGQLQYVGSKCRADIHQVFV